MPYSCHCVCPHCIIKQRMEHKAEQASFCRLLLPIQRVTGSVGLSAVLWPSLAKHTADSKSETECISKNLLYHDSSIMYMLCSDCSVMIVQ